METDLRVPFVIEGPGIAANATLSAVVGSHIDLAPTWLDLAGVVLPPDMDGRSVAPRLLADAELIAALPSTRKTISAGSATGGTIGNIAGGGADGSSAGDSVSAIGGPRAVTVAYIEYHGLGPVGAPGKCYGNWTPSCDKVPSIWCVVCGVWCVVCGVWCMADT
jgi:hypothetical protein